jgi:hypothetical protein
MTLKSFLLLIVLVFTCLAIQVSAGRAYAKGTSVAGSADIWAGTTRVTPCTFSTGRCNAVNKITFSFVPKENQIKGKFTCAYGNLNCRNGGADDTGKIVSGRVSGHLIRFSVMIPADVSHCYYNGKLTSSTAIHGAYACYQGGALLEQGVFDLTKSSSG